MTHSDVQHANVSDRYVMGKLSSQEQLSFEEHLIDCQECLDRVEALEHFSRGLRTALSDNVSTETVLVQTGLLARFTQLARWQQSVLAFAGILLILVPAAGVYVTKVVAERKLHQANEALAHVEHGYAEKQRAVDELEEQLRVSIAKEQQTEAQTKERLHLRASLLLEPVAGVPVFTLNSSRGVGAAPAPPNVISVSRSSKGLILSLEFEPDPEVPTYRVAISRDRKPFWTASDLKPSDKGTIAIIVSADLLKPGDYIIELEGCLHQHDCYPAATYLFRATVTN
jgi:hypothetical protein